MIHAMNYLMNVVGYYFYGSLIKLKAKYGILSGGNRNE